MVFIVKWEKPNELEVIFLEARSSKSVGYNRSTASKKQLAYRLSFD